MKTPSWVSSQKSYIFIFNVGRGLSVFIRTALNQGIIYDFGSSDEFKPTEFLKENIIPYLDKYNGNYIAQAIISHPHSDHIAEISSLSDKMLYPALLTCPHDKTEGSKKPEALDWERIKNPEYSKDLTEIYRSMYKGRSLPLQTVSYESSRVIPNLLYGIYYVRPPVVDVIFQNNDQEYGNGLSLLLYYRHGYHSILIPGDINPQCMEHILDEDYGMEKRFTVFDKTKNPGWHKETSNQPSLRTILQSMDLSILLAPHHGLESGFSSKLYEAMKSKKPGLVVISEKRHLSKQDGKVHPFYQSENGAMGHKVSIEGEEKKDTSYSVSTRNGHHILIVFQGTGGSPKLYRSYALGF